MSRSRIAVCHDRGSRCVTIEDRGVSRSRIEDRAVARCIGVTIEDAIEDRGVAIEDRGVTIEDRGSREQFDRNFVHYGVTDLRWMSSCM